MNDEIIEEMREAVGDKVEVLVLVNSLFDFMNYVDQSDEEEFIYNQDRNISDPMYAQILDLYDFHINKIATTLGIEFSRDGLLFDKYVILSTIIKFKHLEKDYIINLESILEEDNYMFLDKLINYTSEYTLTNPIFETIENIDDDLPETLKKYINETIENEEIGDIDKIINDIKFKKKINLIKNIVKPQNVLGYYFKNNSDNINIDTTSVILWDMVVDSSDVEDKLNKILFIYLMSEYEKDIITKFMDDKSKIIDEIGSDRYDKLFNIISSIQQQILNINRITL